MALSIARSFAVATLLPNSFLPISFGNLQMFLNFGFNAGVKSPHKSRYYDSPHDPFERIMVPGERYWTPSPPHKIDLGDLADRRESGITQLVTFRLTDSLPKSLQSEWEYLLRIEDERKRRTQLETYLDKGCGESYLHREDVAQTVDITIRFFRPERYDLRAWVVMPNHVHVVFKVNTTTWSQIVESWQKESAFWFERRFCFKKPFWESDCWHTVIRDTKHELTAIRYVENNPVNAGLTTDSREWPWSSSRHRDKSGKVLL
jgi:putative transposase